jgi:hypothetical protein
MAGPHPSLSLRQALIAQHDRLLKLTTILGDDMLLPQRVMGHDRLGRSVALRGFSNRSRPTTSWSTSSPHTHRPGGITFRGQNVGIALSTLHPV